MKKSFKILVIHYKLNIPTMTIIYMEGWILAGIAIALVMAGLIGQGFEMRKIRVSTNPDGELGSPNIFLDKRNFKWYVLIGVGIILWYATGGL